MTQKIKELNEKGHTIFSVCSHTGTVMIYYCIIHDTVLQGSHGTNNSTSKTSQTGDINEKKNH